MFLSLRVAAALNFTPMTCCSFFWCRDVSSYTSVAVASFVASTSLATISSWLTSSWELDIVGGASLGDVSEVPTCLGSTLLTQCSYCSLTSWALSEPLCRIVWGRLFWRSVCTARWPRELCLTLHIVRGLRFTVCVTDSVFSDFVWVFGGLLVLSGVSNTDSSTFGLFIQSGVVSLLENFGSFCLSVSSEKFFFWEFNWFPTWNHFSGILNFVWRVWCCGWRTCCRGVSFPAFVHSLLRPSVPVWVWQAFFPVGVAFASNYRFSSFGGCVWRVVFFAFSCVSCVWGAAPFAGSCINGDKPFFVAFHIVSSCHYFVADFFCGEIKLILCWFF